MRGLQRLKEKLNSTKAGLFLACLPLSIVWSNNRDLVGSNDYAE